MYSDLQFLDIKVFNKQKSFNDFLHLWPVISHMYCDDFALTYHGVSALAWGPDLAGFKNSETLYDRFSSHPFLTHTKVNIAVCMPYELD